MIADIPVLSLITFLPLAGMVVTAAVPREHVRMLRGITVAVALVQVAIAVLICLNFNSTLGGINDPKSFQFVERMPWIRVSGLGIFGNLAIDYFMGLDGLSVTMILLTAIIVVIAAIASFSVERNIKGYFL